MHLTQRLAACRLQAQCILSFAILGASLLLSSSGIHSHSQLLSSSGIQSHSQLLSSSGIDATPVSMTISHHLPASPSISLD